MQMIRALSRCSEEKSILPIEDTETTTPTELRISARGPSFATSSAEAMAVKKATGGQVAQRSEAYPGTTAPKNPAAPSDAYDENPSFNPFRKPDWIDL